MVFCLFSSLSLSTAPPLSRSRNMLALKTSALPAPPPALRCPLARASLMTSNRRHPLSLVNFHQSARSSPQATARRRSSMPTRTPLRALASPLEEDDGGARKEEEVQHPPLPLLPPSPPARLALPLAWRALEAALWPELVITWLSAKKREATA